LLLVAGGGVLGEGTEEEGAKVQVRLSGTVVVVVAVVVVVVVVVVVMVLLCRCCY
jgi:hypothetical protein